MTKSIDTSAPKNIRINASCLEGGYSEDSCTLQSLCHFHCYIFRILTNSGNWQSVTRIQYKQRQSLNFHKMALKLNSWKDNADAILENSMKILEVVRSGFWCDTGRAPSLLMFKLIWHSRMSTLQLEIKTTALMPFDHPKRSFVCVTVIRVREGLRTSLTHYFCQTAIKTCSGLVERGGRQLLTIKSCCPRSLRLEMETFSQRMEWELAQTFLCRILRTQLIVPPLHHTLFKDWKIEKEDMKRAGSAGCGRGAETLDTG